MISVGLPRVGHAVNLMGDLQLLKVTGETPKLGGGGVSPFIVYFINLTNFGAKEKLILTL